MLVKIAPLLALPRLSPGLLWGLALAALVATLPAGAVDRPAVAAKRAADARALIARAIDLTRSRSSYVELAMVVHRPDWQRFSRLVSWTRGREDALVRFVAPARDAGNASLKLGERMWTFTPRHDRVIRLPRSMMSQSWAGSDFSYNDLARADDLLTDYDHSILRVGKRDGHRTYLIEAVPKLQAPVVWGKQELLLRDDSVLLEEVFFDQDSQPVKRLIAMEIGALGGRTFATRMRMYNLEEEGRWTEVSYHKAAFNAKIPDRVFTLFNLKNYRR